MRLEEIEIEGWMPFGGEPIRLVLPAGPIGVVGMHGEDARRSNRAGKTSFLEAITWCLFGVHRKRLDDQIIHLGSKACSVTVRMRGLTATRERTRGSSTKLTVVLLNTKLTGTAAQAAISMAVGLAHDDYIATACFPQGDVEAIISRSATERLSLVSDWLQQGRWIEARALQAKKANAAVGKLNEAKAACEVARGYVLSGEQRSAMADESEELLGRIESLEKDIEEISETLESGQLAKHAELRGLRPRARELRDRLKGRALVEQERDRFSEIANELNSAHELARSDLASTEQVRNVGFDGRCPVMCADCPVAEQVTEAVRGASDVYEARSKAERVAKLAWQKADEDLWRVARRVTEFERLAAEYSQLTERGKQLASELVIDDDEVERLTAQVARRDELRAELTTATARRVELVGRLRQSERNDQTYEQLRAKVEAAEVAAQVAALAQRAISAIPARIAAQQLGELERETNLLLEGTGVSVRFSLWRELADWAPTCAACGFAYESPRVGRICVDCSTPREKKRAQELEILCDDGSGVEEDVRYNSGGTRAIVGSAIRLAASAMLRRLRSSQAAWAIVDEPFSSLDAENREQLARTFAGMLSSVGLEQALVVSHDQALLAALPNRIVVTKVGAQSTARLE